MTATKRTILTAACLAMALAAGGCGGRERAASAPAAKAPATVPAPQPAPSPRTDANVAADNGLKPETGEALFTSGEGGFSALFPAGCQRVHTRIFPKGAGQRDRQIVQCYCDMSELKNSGVMVSAYLAIHGEKGGPPTPGNVSAIINEMLQKYGVQVVQQGTLKSKDLPGVRLFARQINGTGEMWFQGMLADERIYVMHAWRPDPQGIDDGQVTRFFNSFKLE